MKSIKNFILESGPMAQIKKMRKLLDEKGKVFKKLSKNYDEKLVKMVGDVLMDMTEDEYYDLDRETFLDEYGYIYGIFTEICSNDDIVKTVYNTIMDVFDIEGLTISEEIINDIIADIDYELSNEDID